MSSSISKYSQPSKPRRQYYREVASVYAMGTKTKDNKSPVKCAVDTWRFTNSKKIGKGESRLLEIAREKFSEHFGQWRTWDKIEGYEHDTIDNVLSMLNIVVFYHVYTVNNGEVVSMDGGRVKW